MLGNVTYVVEPLPEREDTNEVSQGQRRASYAGRSEYRVSTMIEGLFERFCARGLFAETRNVCFADGESLASCLIQSSV